MKPFLAISHPAPPQTQTDQRLKPMDDDQAAYDIRSLDMDGDGGIDLLVAGQASQNVVWYENL